MQKGFSLPLILIGIVLMILIAGGAFYLGRTTKNSGDISNSPTPLSSPSDQVACAQDAKQCPDGSYVARTGPKCEFAACPAVSDKISNWKVYEGNGSLTFKYPSDWEIEPYTNNNVISSNSPKIKLVVVPKDSTLMNECMEEVSVKTKNELTVKKFSRVTTGEMCSTTDSNPREIWIVPSKEAYSPGISYQYSAAEAAQAEEIFDQILITFKFTD